MLLYRNKNVINFEIFFDKEYDFYSEEPFLNAKYYIEEHNSFFALLKNEEIITISDNEEEIIDVALEYISKKDYFFMYDDEKRDIKHKINLFETRHSSKELNQAFFSIYNKNITTEELLEFDKEYTDIIKPRVISKIEDLRNFYLKFEKSNYLNRKVVSGEKKNIFERLLDRKYDVYFIERFFSDLSSVSNFLSKNEELSQYLYEYFAEGILEKDGFFYYISSGKYTKFFTV